ncbi:biotin/lipoyl-binding protein, partial [Burkholderia pseudomallei]
QGQPGGARKRGGPAALANLPQPVPVATAARGEMPVVLNALGTVTPLANVSVRTQLSGYLQAVSFQVGQIVKKGDVLAQIDPRPYQISLAN